MDSEETRGKKTNDAEENSDEEEQEEDMTVIQSFRVAIRLEDREKCLKKEFWPRGVVIRPWKWKQKKETVSTQKNKENSV